jgi:hypothetical protein
MSTLNTIYNIAYKNIDRHTNVLYAPTNNVFDLLVKLTDNNIYDINSTYQHYYYDLFWSNNFLDHTQKTAPLVASLHLLDLLWFHATPPLKFKKEDIALVRNQLVNTYKIFSDDSTKMAWGFNDERSSIIPYGIPTRPEFENVKKTESVLVMNINGSADINGLYRHIKTAVPNAQTIDSLQNIHSIDRLYEIVSKYQIVVDIYNPLNVLIAQYLGCKSITSTAQSENLTGITRLFDYGNINNVLSSIINDTLSPEDINKNQEWIKANHDFSQFTNSVNKILNKIKFEEFFVV